MLSYPHLPAPHLGLRYLESPDAWHVSPTWHGLAQNWPWVFWQQALPRYSCCIWTQHCVGRHCASVTPGKDQVKSHPERKFGLSTWGPPSLLAGNLHLTNQIFSPWTLSAARPLTLSSDTSQHLEPFIPHLPWGNLKRQRGREGIVL